MRRQPHEKAPAAVEPAREGEIVIRDFDVAPAIPADKPEPELSAILRAARDLAERVFERRHGARR